MLYLNDHQEDYAHALMFDLDLSLGYTFPCSLHCNRCLTIGAIGFVCVVAGALPFRASRAVLYTFGDLGRMLVGSRSNSANFAIYLHKDCRIDCYCTDYYTDCYIEGFSFHDC